MSRHNSHLHLNQCQPGGPPDQILGPSFPKSSSFKSLYVPALFMSDLCYPSLSDGTIGITPRLWENWSGIEAWDHDTYQVRPRDLHGLYSGVRNQSLGLGREAEGGGSCSGNWKDSSSSSGPKNAHFVIDKDISLVPTIGGSTVSGWGFWR